MSHSLTSFYHLIWDSDSNSLITGNNEKLKFSIVLEQLAMDLRYILFALAWVARSLFSFCDSLLVFLLANKILYFRANWNLQGKTQRDRDSFLREERRKEKNAILVVKPVRNYLLQRFIEILAIPCVFFVWLRFSFFPTFFYIPIHLRNYVIFSLYGKNNNENLISLNLIIENINFFHSFSLVIKKRSYS